MIGVRIEFTYARGPDHFREPRAPERRPSVIPSYLFAALLFLAGGGYAIAALVSHAGQAASCGLSAALLGALIAVAARQRGRSRFRMPAAAMEPRDWVITDRAIEIGHDGAAWSAFQYVLELPHAYVFVMKDRDDKRTFDIPREPLTEPDDAAVRDVITRHGITFYPHQPKVP
jgi:hypothetical protein